MEAGGRSWRLPRRRAAGSSPGKAAQASRGWRCFSEISALHSGYASPSIPGSSKNTKHAIGNTSLGCLTLAAESLCVVCHLDCINSHKIYRAASSTEQILSLPVTACSTQAVLRIKITPGTQNQLFSSSLILTKKISVYL